MNSQQHLQLAQRRTPPQLCSFQSHFSPATCWGGCLCPGQRLRTVLASSPSDGAAMLRCCDSRCRTLRVQPSNRAVTRLPQPFGLMVPWLGEGGLRSRVWKTRCHQHGLGGSERRAQPVLGLLSCLSPVRFLSWCSCWWPARGHFKRNPSSAPQLGLTRLSRKSNPSTETLKSVPGFEGDAAGSLVTAFPTTGISSSLLFSGVLPTQHAALSGKGEKGLETKPPWESSSAIAVPRLPSQWSKPERQNLFLSS